MGEMNERIDDSSPAFCSISLTRDEARVLKASIQDWIERTGRKRMWPWRRLGWVDAFIYSRSVYVSARDKLDDALKSNAGPHGSAASDDTVEAFVR